MDDPADKTEADQTQWQQCNFSRWTATPIVESWTRATSQLEGLAEILNKNSQLHGHDLLKGIVASPQNTTAQAGLGDPPFMPTLPRSVSGEGPKEDICSTYHEPVQPVW